MSIKSIRLLVITFILNVGLQMPVSASESTILNTGYSMMNLSQNLIEQRTDLSKLYTKLGEPYNEANDPAMHKSSPPEEGPQHGYFSVSLLVLAIVGVLLYFAKVDSD